MKASIDILYEGYVKEGDDAEIVRNTVCLVRDGSIKMVVDPGLLSSVGVIAEALQKHNLSFDDITHVYVTHLHMDHVRNVGLFQKAIIFDYMYTYEGEKWGQHSGDGHKLTENISILHTPGHTIDDSALLVNTERGLVAISHVWWHEDRTPDEDPMATDQEQLEQSRKKVEEVAEWVITPHGGMFKLVK